MKVLEFTHGNVCHYLQFIHFHCYEILFHLMYILQLIYFFVLIFIWVVFTFFLLLIVLPGTVWDTWERISLVYCCCMKYIYLYCIYIYRRENPGLQGLHISPLLGNANLFHQQ